MKAMAWAVLWIVWVLQKEDRREIERAWEIFAAETAKARNRMRIKEQIERGGRGYGLRAWEDIGA